MDTIGDLDGLDTVGDDVVGQLVRAAAMAPRGGARGRGPMWLRSASKAGVAAPAEELDYLPFVTVVLDSATPNGNATAFPQRPFRGERLIANASYVTAAGAFSNASDVVIISPAIYVGAVQVGASQGDTPLSAFRADAFGVRLSMPSAGQGTRIFIPYVTTVPIAAGDRIIVNFTLIGRAVR